MPADISFASFNLYNFQKAGERTYPQSPIVNQERYLSQRDWIAAKLREIDADIVAFQELWNKECLEDAISNLSNYSAHYIGNSWSNTAVAIIVREPWNVVSQETIKLLPFEQIVKTDDNDGEDDELTLSIKKFSRSVLKVEIENTSNSRTPNITMFACHLKSKLPAKHISEKAIASAVSTIRRTAEAAGLRIILDEHMAGASTPTVVIGDLNDDPLSNTLNILTTQPTMTKRSRGGDKSLYNTLFLEQLKSFRDVFYTHEFKNHLGVIDHILVSEEFFEHSSDAVWEHKDTRVWNDHISDDKNFTSDHGIIKSSFK